MKRFFLKIASLFYGAVIKLRHLMFDADILHSEKFDIPILCVGNITVGGTGKTPVVEMLVDHYSEQYNVAVLSRGYGRTTKGYRVVETTDRYRVVGDEPLQIKRKFPNVVVVVCEKRAFAINRIRQEFPEVNMIIMDDGFQHRYVQPLLNIITVDATRPVLKDNLVPLGQLRDSVDSLRRAHYFIVTKCPDNMQPIGMRLFRKDLVMKPSQEIFFSRMSAGEPTPVFSEVEGTVAHGAEVIAMSGIGNSEAFNNGLRSRYKVVDELNLDDHYSYKVADLARIKALLDKHPNAVIMTTEKDAVKLCNSKAVPTEIRERMFFERITLKFVGDGRREMFGRIDNDLKNCANGTYIKGF